MDEPILFLPFDGRQKLTGKQYIGISAARCEENSLLHLAILSCPRHSGLTQMLYQTDLQAEADAA